MDLIDDHGRDIPKNLAAFFGSQQQKQGLRRRHQDVRRLQEHSPPIPSWSVTGSNFHPQIRNQYSCTDGSLADLCKGLLQILLDVIAKSLQRRHVEYLGPFFQVSGKRLFEEIINTCQKSRQRLPRSGGGSNQGIGPGDNGWPAFQLDVGGLAKAISKPVRDYRMKKRKSHGSIVTLTQDLAPPHSSGYWVCRVASVLKLPYLPPGVIPGGWRLDPLLAALLIPPFR